ncbi:hypothetical protein CKK33_16815 [Mucilaginibacter sp. MD40]|uniref:hypothetical protein n=1 Tax=Mucilaginibacter sp. MD40 TaxID=2029590 RepID=UPI000BAC5DCD|nr:hypothetical protein [Mucilaginibacter sp. MD40]PAW95065.1 hypothetical protein CKK33_16815 [Mucilaginibacter sp. MD40]
MTVNQQKLVDAALQAKDNRDHHDARYWGVELFGHMHRTAMSLQSRPMPLICIEDLGEYYYRPYAFYVHNPLICGHTETILKMPYLIDFCIACRGVVKPPDWYLDVADR